MMTERESIRECKEMWGEIRESGLSKMDFLGTEAGNKWKMKDYDSSCPLCEYVVQQPRVIGVSACGYYCPVYAKVNKTCYTLGYDENPPTPKWFALVESL